MSTFDDLGLSWKSKAAWKDSVLERMPPDARTAVETRIASFQQLLSDRVEAIAAVIAYDMLIAELEAV
jgi:hypothetical protein